MRYVVYNARNGKMYKPYPTQKAAAIAAGHLSHDGEAYAACSEAIYNARGRTKLVRSRKSGKMVRVPIDAPFCCDPSTKAYWEV